MAKTFNEVLTGWTRRSKLLKNGVWIAGSFMAFVTIRLRKAGWGITETVVYDTILLRDYPKALLPLPPLKVGFDSRENAVSAANKWIFAAEKRIESRGRMMCGGC